ncbi:alpha-L-fucosidase [Neoactinobaculum massilliense]|uniref:alpha-L-fucosidase n=1 Tax=Neoactinobaculum massilliense TaxID=2364794 RepID=UPI0013DDBCA4|nr:alpha-L-fucosidase [Neoactinobaculum massilliense]
MATTFDATKWARLIARAGMKYGVFTSKHHDGFSMYDTKYSNLKSTAEDTLLQRDVFGEVTSAFQREGIETGVYYSKADWSRPEYWDLARPIHDRFANYDVTTQPKRWSRFVQFVHDQVEELLTNYGPQLMLWLDAGWVRPPREDIDIDGLATLARSIQPGILMVDREVHGPQENYRTPEQEVPEHYLPYPWESCITWTKSWCSMQKDDPAKPTWQIIANLLRIVARGGNYLVGFGPDQTGALSTYVERGLQELGTWMDGHGEGIYSTRAIPTQPEIHQVSGEPAEWFIVRKRFDVEPPAAADVPVSVYYLYGVPRAGTCAPAEVTIDLPQAHAEALGGSRAIARREGGRLAVQLTPASDEMGYVVRLF